MDVNHSLLSSLAHQDSNIFLVVLEQVFSKNGWAFCVTHNTVVAYPVFCGRNTSVALVSSLICFLIQALRKAFWISGSIRCDPYAPQSTSDMSSGVDFCIKSKLFYPAIQASQWQSTMGCTHRASPMQQVTAWRWLSGTIITEIAPWTVKCLPPYWWEWNFDLYTTFCDGIIHCCDLTPLRRNSSWHCRHPTLVRQKIQRKIPKSIAERLKDENFANNWLLATSESARGFFGLQAWIFWTTKWFKSYRRKPYSCYLCKSSRRRPLTTKRRWDNDTIRTHTISTTTNATVWRT